MSRRAVGKKAQSGGRNAQDVVVMQLRAMGFLMVEQTATPARYIPHPSIRGYFRVVRDEKVSADIVALPPDGTGRRVMVEVKNTSGDENLAYSQFKPHQLERLAENERGGGVSVIAWVRPFGQFYMRFPAVVGLVPRKSIAPDYAAILDAEFMATL